MKDMQIEKEEKETQEAGRSKAGRHSREKLFKAEISFDRHNVTASGIMVCIMIVLLLIEPSLLLDTNEDNEKIFHGGFLVAYTALTIFSALLCVVKIKLPETVTKIVGWLALFLVPLGTFFAVDLINGTRILDFTFERCLANYLCYFMVFALIHAISRRVWITVMVGGGAFLIFGIANYFVVQFRGLPILPWDFQTISTAITVSGGYNYIFTREMFLSAAALLAAVLLCLRTTPVGRGSASKCVHVAERLSALTVSLALAILIFPMDLLSDMGISVWAWNQKTSSELTGVMTGFFANVQFVMVDKPEGYSAKKVEQLGEEINEMEEPTALGQPEGQPTVVVIMNESFTDMQSVGDIELEPDNLPFIHSLQQSGDVIWGTAYSSVYGGNTCNSEYEFLTGNTTAFMPTGSKPYQQYVDSDQTALPAIFKSYGYKNIAIHPGNRGAWQRDTAYPYLGFDRFVDAKSFDIDRRFIHGLTSDRSGYDQVIYEYEHRDKARGLFLFNVTIQNHGGYEDEDLATTVHVKQPGLGLSPMGESLFPQAEQYLSLTKESDTAFEELIDYFSRQEDPVIVLFFGDHWPNLEPEFITELLGTDSDSLSFENMMREYQVPFLIWANYPLQGQHVEAVSLNYLSGLLLRAAGMEGTGYTKYLEGLRQQLPVITAVGTIDSAGNIYENGEETPYDELLNEYAILQYNNAFGSEEKAEEIFAR